MAINIRDILYPEQKTGIMDILGTVGEGLSDLGEPDYGMLQYIDDPLARMFYARGAQSSGWETGLGAVGRGLSKMLQAKKDKLLLKGVQDAWKTGEYTLLPDMDTEGNITGFKFKQKDYLEREKKQADLERTQQQTILDRWRQLAEQARIGRYGQTAEEQAVKDFFREVYAKKMGKAGAYLEETGYPEERTPMMSRIAQQLAEIRARGGLPGTVAKPAFPTKPKPKTKVSLLDQILERTSPSKGAQKYPYPEYPDAFLEDGAWKVFRNGRKYRIEE